MIEKLEIGDQRPFTIIDKLNELIDAFNEYLTTDPPSPNPIQKGPDS
jgi:hypothetical protein